MFQHKALVFKARKMGMCLKTFYSSSAPILEAPSICVWGTKSVSCNNITDLHYAVEEETSPSYKAPITYKFADLKSDFLVLLCLPTDNIICTLWTEVQPLCPVLDISLLQFVLQGITATRLFLWSSGTTELCRGS